MKERILSSTLNLAALTEVSGFQKEEILLDR